MRSPGFFSLILFSAMLTSVALFLFSGGAMVAVAQTEFFNEEEPPPPQEEPQQPPPPGAPPVQEAPPAPAPAPVVGGQPGADVLFLMDVSGSMESYLLDEKMNKLDSAKTALSNVVEKMKNNARFQLWTFSATVIQQPGSIVKERPKKRGAFASIGGPAREDLLEVIRNIEIPGKLASVTNLYAAILQAMQYFESHAYKPSESGAASEKLIVVLSDGRDDEVSPVNLGTILIAKDEFPDIEIRTIGFGIEKNDPFHRILCTLATKNTCALAKDAAELQKVVSSFVNS